MAQAGFLPTSIKDETGAIARREADANDKLAQLFYALMQRREDRKRAEEMQMRMFGLRNAEWDRRRSVTHPDDGDPTINNPLYRPGGGAGGDRGAPDATGPAPVSGSAPILPAGAFVKTSSLEGGGGDNTITGGAADDPMNAMAQASSGDVAKNRDRDAYKPRTTAPASTQLPKLPSAKQRKTQSAFLPIPDELQQHMENVEKKYGLPRGMMLTALGYENGGGRVYGKNPNSSATGWYQFTQDLRKTYNLSDADTQDPYKMTEIAGRNMRRNAMQLEKVGGYKLGDSVGEIPFYMLLHKWGNGDGPRIVTAALRNPDVPMVNVMLKLAGRDNARVLVNNQFASDASVRNVIDLENKHINPWMYAAIKLQEQRATGQAPQAPQAPQQQQASAGPQVAGGQQPPRPPRDIPEDTRGANPRLVRAIREGAKLALPPNYKIVQTSGHRPGDSGYHGRREAADFQIVTPDGTHIPNKGPDTTGLYTRIARGVKTWVTENDPQLAAVINWGGSHSTSKRGGNVADLMHYDTGGSRGQLHPERQFARLQPLGANERNTVPTTQVARAPQAAPTDASSQRVALSQLPTATNPAEASRFTGGGPTTQAAAPKSAMAAAAAPAPRAAAPTQQPEAITDEIMQPNVPLPRPRSGALAGGEQVPMPPYKQPQELPTSDLSLEEGAQSFDEAGFTMPQVEPRGAQSVDEAGMQIDTTPIPPAAAGNEYAATPMGARSFDEAGMQGADYSNPPMPYGASGVDEAGMQFDTTPVADAAVGNEFEPPPPPGMLDKFKTNFALRRPWPSAAEAQASQETPDAIRAQTRAPRDTNVLGQTLPADFTTFTEDARYQAQQAKDWIGDLFRNTVKSADDYTRPPEEGDPTAAKLKQLPDRAAAAWEVIQRAIEARKAGVPVEGANPTMQKVIDSIFKPSSGVIGAASSASNVGANFQRPNIPAFDPGTSAANTGGTASFTDMWNAGKRYIVPDASNPTTQSPQAPVKQVPAPQVPQPAPQAPQPLVVQPAQPAQPAQPTPPAPPNASPAQPGMIQRLIDAIFKSKPAAPAAAAPNPADVPRRVRTERFMPDGMTSRDFMPDGTPYLRDTPKFTVEPKPRGGVIPDGGIPAVGTTPPAANPAQVPLPKKQSMMMPSAMPPALRQVDPNNPDEYLYMPPDELEMTA